MGGVPKGHRRVLGEARDQALTIELSRKRPGPLKNEDQERIEKLNDRHAGVMIGGKFVIMNEVVDPVFNRPDITFSSVTDFRNRYSNDLIWIQTKRGMESHSVATEWLKWEGRRDYEGIVFAPGREIKGYYNLYKGLALQPRKGKWDLLRKHIEENICCGIGMYSHYLFDWMADAVQDPGGLRPGTSIVLRGGRGTGKGLFAGTFGLIFGSHYLHLRDQNHLTGRFNSHHKDALIIFADECFWAGNKTSEGLLKGLITEPTIHVEQKGKDPYTVQNHIRLIVASNEDWIIPAGIDERRFFVMDVRDTHKQDIKYWDPIWDEVRNGGAEAMLYDLLERKYEKTWLRTPPKTAALLDQIEQSMDCVEQFWYSRLKDGCILKESTKWEKEVQTSLFYDEFVLYCRIIGEKYIPNDKIFGKRLRKMCSKLKKGRKTFENGGKQEYCLIFPDLKACRSEFDSLASMCIPWGEDSL